MAHVAAEDKRPPIVTAGSQATWLSRNRLKYSVCSAVGSGIEVVLLASDIEIPEVVVKDGRERLAERLL